MLKKFFRKFLKQKTEKEITQNAEEFREETAYERERRLFCEEYFEQKNLIRWETKNLPCVMLETLDDMGLITMRDTIVYLPPDAIVQVKVVPFLKTNQI